MNCLDCRDVETPAVAVCGRCGAGQCREHLIQRDEPLFVRNPINVPVAVDPPARRLRCGVCATAEAAQAQTGGVAI